jgi:hypothetical protein
MQEPKLPLEIHGLVLLVLKETIEDAWPLSPAAQVLGDWLEEENHPDYAARVRLTRIERNEGQPSRVEMARILMRRTSALDSLQGKVVIKRPGEGALATAILDGSILMVEAALKITPQYRNADYELDPFSRRGALFFIPSDRNVEGELHGVVQGEGEAALTRLVYQRSGGTAGSDGRFGAGELVILANDRTITIFNVRVSWMTREPRLGMYEFTFAGRTLPGALEDFTRPVS